MWSACSSAKNVARDSLKFSHDLRTVQDLYCLLCSTSLMRARIVIYNITREACYARCETRWHYYERRHYSDARDTYTRLSNPEILVVGALFLVVNCRFSYTIEHFSERTYVRMDEAHPRVSSVREIAICLCIFSVVEKLHWTIKTPIHLFVGECRTNLTQYFY